MIAGLEPVRERIQVFVAACDPVSRDGVASQLRGHAVELVDERGLDPDVVALVVVDEVDEQAARDIRSLRRRGIESLVVVATRVDDAGLLAAVEAGATGVLRRSQSSPRRCSAASGRRAPGRARCLPTSWAGCSARWGGCSGRS